jgi:hypothetical protein
MQLQIDFWNEIFPWLLFQNIENSSIYIYIYLKNRMKINWNIFFSGNGGKKYEMINLKVQPHSTIALRL